MVTALTAIVAAALLQTHFEPNYADRMLTPYEGSDVPARLFPARPTSPVKVAVVPDPAFVTDARLDLIKTACERWATATADRPRPFTFAYVETFGPVPADVVIRFARRAGPDTTCGLTRERAGWASMELAVEDERGRDLDPKFIVRVACHEIGHALGIWGHSPDPNDIMSLDKGAATISIADVNTLELAYWKPWLAHGTAR